MKCSGFLKQSLPAIAMFCSVFLIAAPAWAEPDSTVPTSTLDPVAAAPGFSKIGPVAKNLWPFNALNVYDSKLKTDVFYITSFNSAGFGQLIRLDYHHDKAQSWTLPAGIGSWGIIRGKDGNLYMGSYDEGKLLCFDPRTETWIPLPQASEEFRKKESIIASLAQAPDGSIYYGTYPGAHLVRYDPVARTVTDLGRAADENYLRQLAVTPEGIVLAGVATRNSRIIAYDPKTRIFSELAPEQYRGSGVSNRPLVGARYMVQPGSEQVLVYDAHSLKLLNVFPVHEASGFNLLDENHMIYQKGSRIESLNLRDGTIKPYVDIKGNVLQGLWYLTPQGNMLGLRVQSYTYIDVKAHSTERHSIRISGLGQDVFWLRSLEDGTIYGGPGLGQTMFAYNPANSQLKSFDQVIDNGGEIYYGVPFHNKLYTISYTEATLAVYDSASKWNQGNLADSNPRTILHIPQHQYRPVGGIHTGPDSKLYIGTQPDYGVVGGALSVFDPTTEKLDVYRNLIPDEEIGAMATDEHFVYCEADPAGGGGSKATVSGVHFFVWDPQLHKIMFDQVFPDDHAFSAIATSQGKAYFVARDELMEFDSVTQKLASLYKFDEVRTIPIESLRAAKDGTLWGILGRELAHIDPSTRKVDFFPETAGKATSGLTIGRDGSIYFGAHTDVWIYRPATPSPPADFGQ